MPDTPPTPGAPPPRSGPVGAGRRLLHAVGLGPLLVTLTFVVLALGLVAIERALLDDLLVAELELLSGHMRSASDRMHAEMRAAEARVDGLRRALEAGIPAPAAADRAAFARLFARQADGSWRPRVEDFVPAREAGGWLPAGTPDAATVNLVVHAKQLLDSLGPEILSESFDDVWVMPKTGGEIILYPSDPAFVWQQDPATDYAPTSWLTLAAPERNPERGIRWTEDILATSEKEWYVSVLAPIWLHGQWMGSAGQDLTIGKLVDEVSGGIRDAGGWIVVLGADRKVLFSTAHRAELAAGAGQFGIDRLGLVGLGAVLDEADDRRASDGGLARRDTPQAYLLAAPLDPPGWTVVGVLPRSTIAAAIARSIMTGRLFVVAGIGALVLVSLLVIHRETRRRRRSEEASRERERWFTRLFNLLPDGVAMLRPDTGAVVEANPGFARLLGGGRDDVLGSTVLELGIWTDPGPLRDVLAELERREVVRAVPLTFRRGDGGRVDVLLTGRLIDFRGERMILAVFTDVSAQRQLEEQLGQAQKMEAVGRLAGGVAHDFNNLITAVAGYAELLRDSLPDEDPRRADAGEILRAAQRGTALTSQLLGFARRQIVQPRTVDLQSLVLGLAKLLERLLGEDIRLELHADAPVPPVRADVGQLEQVITNLAVNARDAMPDGGRLTIGLEAGNGEVVLRVTDTGSGVPPDVLPHIFEPFFTTKGQGKGTGLGLATCYGIVRQAGGRIEVDSAVGSGTTFRVLLPAAAGEPGPTAAAPAAAADEPSGEERILVVEDEPQVRQFVARSLASLGYQVSPVDNGLEALALAAERSEPFDLVVTDVVMPLMGGVELVGRLRERWPSLEALYLSGYTDDRVLHAEIAADPLRFLSKPFTRDALARRVRELLARRGPMPDGRAG